MIQKVDKQVMKLMIRRMGKSFNADSREAKRFIKANAYFSLSNTNHPAIQEN